MSLWLIPATAGGGLAAWWIITGEIAYRRQRQQ